MTPTADAPGLGTNRVSSVTDGDTLRLATGEAVRLVGMDAPEPGRCGSERATRLLTDLTLGEEVTLPAPVDDQDRYGRLLRYVDVGGVDAGLQLIKRGLAIARLRLPRRLRPAPAAGAVRPRGPREHERPLPSLSQKRLTPALE